METRPHAQRRERVGSDDRRNREPARWDDCHTHTRFSDGSAMASMLEAAVAAGCDGIGLTDHCILVDDDQGRRDRFDLVEMYERRRERIDELRDRYAVDVYDAVECNYVPGTEARIESFLADADFEYAIGSVHLVDGRDITSAAPFATRSLEERRDAVDSYYEAVVRLVESELFEIVGHIDLPERIEPLRGLTTATHYRAVADALASSSTVPELNAGRVHRGLGRLHPNPEFLEPFLERDIEFVLGTDGHAPTELRERFETLQTFVRERPELDLVAPPVDSRP